MVVGVILACVGHPLFYMQVYYISRFRSGIHTLDLSDKCSMYCRQG